MGGFIITSDRRGATFDDADIRLAQTLAGQVAGVIERAQLLDEAVRARAAAEAANQSKGQLLTTISHELRTPLAGILGYTQLLALDDSLAASQRELIALVEQSSKHLLALINDLLDLAQIESGTITLDVEAFDFGMFVTQISLMAETWARQKGLAFQLIIDAVWLTDGLTCRPRADVRRLRQVLINLLGNAVKFTSSGQVTFTVGNLLHAEAPQHQALRFQIDDTGIGIPHEELARVFMPFHQVGAAAQRAAGTGLGLTICVELLRLMGSSLHIESTSGVGSSFWFELVLPCDEHAAL